MKSSTGPKRKSRLQGHRKRRRKLRAFEPAPGAPVDWIEYKTMLQYRPMGDLLDQMRQYGYRGGIQSLMEKNCSPGDEWLQDFTAEDLSEKAV